MVVLMLGGGQPPASLLSLAVRLLTESRLCMLLMPTVFHGWYHQAHTGAGGRHPSPPGLGAAAFVGGDAGAEGG
ncbi:MAG: hypothetical protein ACLRWQ_15835 [Flavonifractor plautii]